MIRPIWNDFQARKKTRTHHEWNEVECYVTQKADDIMFDLNIVESMKIIFFQ